MVPVVYQKLKAFIAIEVIIKCKGNYGPPCIFRNLPPVYTPDINYSPAKSDPRPHLGYIQVSTRHRPVMRLAAMETFKDIAYVMLYIIIYIYSKLFIIKF